MTELFWHIWNQLILCSQYEVTAVDAPVIFEKIEKQVIEVWNKQQITMRQYLILSNAVEEWREILSKPP